MRKLFTIALLMFAFGAAVAQDSLTQTNMMINTVVVNTTGDVVLRQGPAFSVYSDGSDSQWTTQDSVLFLNGRNDYVVTVEALGYLELSSSGDVLASETLRADNLVVRSTGSGDVDLNLDYGNVVVQLSGSGDVILQGQCDKLQIDNTGSGEVINMMGGGKRVVPNLEGLSELMAELGTNLERLSDSVDWQSFERDMERWGQGMEEWGRHMEEWGKQVERRMDGRDHNRNKDDKPYVGPRIEKKPGKNTGKDSREPKKQSLLFNPHWSGVDAGLNLLLGPGSTANFEGAYRFLELKPLKSWVFNFNIADVGIAFSRSHVAGLYTGIGLGWNNYSLNHAVRLEKGDSHLEGHWIDESTEGHVRKSKLGVLYVQAPVMLEIRPARHFFIAAGVTGGIRVDAWTKVKFEDKRKEKTHSDYYVNLLKLDATLRAGSDDFGFFASYNLLPLFVESSGPSAHTLNIGFSLIF